MNRSARLSTYLILAGSLSLFAACGGGNGGSGASDANGSSSNGGSVSTPGTISQAPQQAPRDSAIFESPETLSRFLATASFGASRGDMDTLVGASASDWFLQQLDIPSSQYLPIVRKYRDAAVDDRQDGLFRYIVSAVSFWQNAVEGSDQLRQRMAYALAQIVVVSDVGSDLIADQPQALAYYRDVLSQHALGNYRDLLQDITYSPAMAYYLTYLGNLPEDPDTGRQPDENYAREIMQLFTIGLVELNIDGTQKLDAQGEPIETYNSADIDGLARVFTGLDIDGYNYWENPELLSQSLAVDQDRHSTKEKTFLGTSIPAGTPGDESVSLALDALFEHDNVGPFLGRQLIQRFTTSNPSPAYTQRVAEAFNSGSFVLPNNTQVGEGRRGDLTATLAAVLFDPEAQPESARDRNDFGKPREPVLRFLQWARAFGVEGSSPELTPILYDTRSNEALAQQANRPNSVFNFYRPGYVAPGTESGSRGMTVPELQLVNASSTPGYINFMNFFIFREPQRGHNLDFLRESFAGSGFDSNIEERARASFVPDYSLELALAQDPQALVEHLDALLAHGALEDGTVEAIAELVGEIALERQDYQQEGDDGRHVRVYFAVLMVMTAPEYLVQQ